LIQVKPLDTDQQDQAASVGGLFHSRIWLAGI
jgi:hypothetical protein